MIDHLTASGVVMKSYALVCFLMTSLQRSLLVNAGKK